MMCYENVLRFFGAYPRNGIPTNFQIYPTNTAILSLHYGNKHAKIVQKHAAIHFCFPNTKLLVAGI